MIQSKEEILTDALRTSIEYNYTIIKLKRIIYILIASNVCLFIGLLCNG